MTTIAEKDLIFTFNDRWTVVKYDDNGSYYKCNIAKFLEGTKAVDFLCISSAEDVVMMEIKDFRKGVPHSQKIRKIPNTVAAKVRDTIAGIIACCKKSPNDKRFYLLMIQKILFESKDLPIVVFFFEDLNTPKRQDPKATFATNGIILKTLKTHLKWLTRQVYVVGLHNYSDVLEGLTVKSA